MFKSIYLIMLLLALLLAGCSTECRPRCYGEDSCCAIDTDGDNSLSMHDDSFACKSNLESCSQSAAGSYYQFPYRGIVGEGVCDGECQKVSIFSAIGDAVGLDATINTLARTRYRSELSAYASESGFELDNPKLCISACSKPDSVCPTTSVANGVTFGLINVYSKMTKATVEGRDNYPIADLYAEYGIDPLVNDCPRSDIVISNYSITNLGEECRANISRSINSDTISGYMIAPAVIDGLFRDDQLGVLFEQQERAFSLEINDATNQSLLGGYVNQAMVVGGQVTVRVNSETGPYCTKLMAQSTLEDTFLKSMLPAISDHATREGIKAVISELVEHVQEEDEVLDNFRQGESMDDELMSAYATFFPLSSSLYSRRGGDEGFKELEESINSNEDLSQLFGGDGVTKVQDLLRLADYAYCALRYKPSEMSNPMGGYLSRSADEGRTAQVEFVAGEFMRCITVASSVDSVALRELSPFD